MGDFFTSYYLLKASGLQHNQEIIRKSHERPFSIMKASFYDMMTWNLDLGSTVCLPLLHIIHIFFLSKVVVTWGFPINTTRTLRVKKVVALSLSLSGGKKPPAAMRKWNHTVSCSFLRPPSSLLSSRFDRWQFITEKIGAPFPISRRRSGKSTYVYDPSRRDVMMEACPLRACERAVKKNTRLGRRKDQ